MERSEAIRALVRYALDRGLIQPSEEIWAVNALLEALSLDSYTPPEGEPAVEAELPAILDTLVDDAYARGVEIQNEAETLLLDDNYFDMNAGTKRIRILSGHTRGLHCRSVYDIGREE